MKIYFPLAKIDAEKHEVWGYASTEARDEQGEVVKRDALISALGDYMQFANIREMHQLSAVGVAKEAAVDDKGLYVGAKIVDPVAWQKVVEGVYKGYSIGGRVTDRDPGDYKTITGLVLNEISLVHRPANPEAIFDYWKSAGGPEMPEVPLGLPFPRARSVPEHHHLVRSDAVSCPEKMSETDSITTVKFSGSTAESAPDKSNTGVADGSAYDDDDYADPGYQPDGQKRYPISTEPHIRAAWNFINRSNNAQRYTPEQLDKIKARIVAAWKQKIDKDGPPALKQEKNTKLLFRAQVPLTKALGDVGNVTRILCDLTWLQESLAAGAWIAEDNSTEPSRVQALLSELCGFLSTLVTEETSEILDQADLTGELPIGKAADTLIVAAGAQGAMLIADLCRGRNQRLQQLAAAILIKSRQGDADQALLDIAHQAISQCLRTHGLLSSEKGHLAMAREALNAAGTLAGEAADADAEPASKDRPPMVRAASSVFHSDDNGALNSGVYPSSTSKVIEMIAVALSKGAPGHLALLDLAHGCISKLTNGACCHAEEIEDHGTPSKTGFTLMRERIGTMKNSGPNEAGISWRSSSTSRQWSHGRSRLRNRSANHRRWRLSGRGMARHPLWRLRVAHRRPWTVWRGR